MRQALTIDDYLTDPVGAFFADRAFAFFFPHQHLCGYVAWGHPSPLDFERVERTWSVVHSPTKSPHATLLDFRAMEGLEPGAFQVASRSTVDNSKALGRAITRLALLRGEGLAGAAIAGFFNVVPAYSPVQVFTEVDDALDWLGRSPDKGWFDAFHRSLLPIYRQPGLVLELQGVLEANPKISIAEAAARLRTSPRTLQRRLRELGTTLTAEVNCAKVRAAERLLLQTEASLTQIAYDVGCASAQHFSTLFRKVTGEAPSEWRARRIPGTRIL